MIEKFLKLRKINLGDIFPVIISSIYKRIVAIFSKKVFQCKAVIHGVTYNQKDGYIWQGALK